MFESATYIKPICYETDSLTLVIRKLLIVKILIAGLFIYQPDHLLLNFFTERKNILQS